LDILVFFYGELVGEGGDGSGAAGDEAVVPGRFGVAVESWDDVLSEVLL
jgi:hypothetical protein